MSTQDAVNYNATVLTASAAISPVTAGRRLGGIFCSSSTSGTVKVWDNTAASGTVLVDTFTVAAGTFYQLPAIARNGLYITIANTATITVFWL